MDPQTLEAALKAYILEMRNRLKQAASIAKAADMCAETGHICKAIEIALDIEQLIYEVNVTRYLERGNP